MNNPTKHIRLFLLASIGMSVCTSCDTDNAMVEKEEVLLNVSIAKTTPTRVNMDGDGFEDGDQFGFFFLQDKPTAVTSTYTYNSSKWTYSTPTYWDDYARDVERYFCAVMPWNGYVINTSDPYDHTFSVQKSQETDDNYKASDLLIARVKTNERLIPIEFNHAFARAIVNITSYIDLNGGITISMNNTATKATLAYVNEPFSVVGIASTSVPDDIVMHPVKVDGKEATFIAIVPPQDITATKLLTTTITVNNVAKAYYFTLASDVTAEFKQGNETTINVTLNKTDVELSDVENAIKIAPWGTIDLKDDNPIKL